jgi:hypothetical protein
MTIEKKIVFHIALLLCVMAFTIVSIAGTGRRMGTAGAQELLIPVGSVGTALGGANLANVSGIEALYWNPAGLSHTESTAEAMFSHMQYIADIDVNYVAGQFVASALGSFGVSVKSLTFGDIPVTTNANPDGTGEIYSPAFITFGLAFSRAMTDKIYFGTHAKLVSEKIMSETATGIAFDFGLQYDTGTGVKAGVTLKNIGSNMTFNGNDLEIFTGDISDRPDTEGENTRIPLASFELPATFEMGISYDYRLGEMNRFTFMGSFMNNNFAMDEYRLAGEYALNDMFFLRGAYVIGYDADDDKFRTADSNSYLWGPSFGGGFNLQLGNMNLYLDYAYRLAELFDNNQWFSFRIAF